MHVSSIHKHPRRALLDPHQRGDNNRAWSCPASVENTIVQTNTMSFVSAAHSADHGSIVGDDCSRDHAFNHLQTRPLAALEQPGNDG